RRDGTPPPPVVVTVTDASQEPVPEPAKPTTSYTDTVSISSSVTSSFTANNPEFCINHRNVPTVFICRDCANTYCKACPSSYGGSVKIWPSCGGRCNAREQVKATKQKAAMFQEASEKGFGFSDFGQAIAYPLKFKLSLFFGALFFTLFSLGRG